MIGRWHIYWNDKHGNAHMCSVTTSEALEAVQLMILDTGGWVVNVIPE